MYGPEILDTWPRCRPGGRVLISIEFLQSMADRFPRVREMLQHLAAVHAEPLNASRIGRKMHVSCHTILARIAVLRRMGVVRLLRSTANHRPTLYLRDCRLLVDSGADDEAILRGCLPERVTAMYRAL